MKRYKLAFIGGGINSAIGNSHFIASRMDNRFELSAGAFSRDSFINQKTAGVYGVGRDKVYDDWRLLLKNERYDIDAVVILTPTDRHFEIASKSLEAGIPVICEKALACDVNQAEKLIRIQNKNNGFLNVIYNYTGFPLIRELRNLVRENRLGKILHFQAEMPQDSYINKRSASKTQGWRLKDGRIPGIYLDLASHLYHLVYFLISKYPRQVTTVQNNFGIHKGIIDNVNCICEYDDHISGHFWFSKSSVGHKNGLRIRLYGEKASAEWIQESPEFIRLAHNNGKTEILSRASSARSDASKSLNRFKPGHPSGFIEALANYYNTIYDNLRKHYRKEDFDDYLYGPEISIMGLKFSEAMIKSSASKIWEKIN